MGSDGFAQFVGWTETFDGAPPEYSLAQALGIRPATLPPSAAFLLSELDPEAPLAAEATQFAASYRAYWAFQDLMEAQLVLDAPFEYRHYCYYESLGYLREIGRCLLNGNYLAVLTILRPFIELSTLHLYWRARDDEYTLFYAWIRTGKGKPPFKNCLEELFRNLPVRDRLDSTRLTQLKDDIQSLYREACAYTHVAHLDESYVTLSRGNIAASVDAASAALAQSRLVIRQVLFLYGLAYPMVMFPRAVEQKFGIGGPVGLFASHETAALYEMAIGTTNQAKLRASLHLDPGIIERLRWFDQQEDASEAEIEASWQEHLAYAPTADPPRDLKLRMAHMRANVRALGWMFNYAELKTSFVSTDVSEETSREGTSW